MDQKAITSEETTDGTKYSLFYSALEEDKFNTDFRSIKECIDKISGSLPTTDVSLRPSTYFKSRIPVRSLHKKR